MQIIKRALTDRFQHALAEESADSHAIKESSAEETLSERSRASTVSFYGPLEEVNYGKEYLYVYQSHSGIGITPDAD